MSWQTGLILVVVIATALPWVIAEVAAVLEMRRRARRREAYKRYCEMINHD